MLFKISEIYFCNTGYGYAAFYHGKQIPGTERVSKEEVEEIDFEKLLKSEKEKWR